MMMSMNIPLTYREHDKMWENVRYFSLNPINALFISFFKILTETYLLYTMYL